MPLGEAERRTSMDSANSKILESVATRILNGEYSAEEACKVLNTVAKFEERVDSVDLKERH